MDDLTAVRLCAEAMGIDLTALGPGLHGYVARDGRAIPYDPLTDDAQAMALVKKFGLICDPQHDGQDFVADPGWEVSWPPQVDSLYINPSLNRAIVYAVAALQSHAAKN